jgi:hypothetical protein
MICCSTKNNKYIEEYSKLKEFAKNLGYIVVDSDCDSWDYSSKTISNNSRRTLENRVIYLAHECGHAKLYLDRKNIYTSLFPGFLQKGINNKVSALEQEVLAWDEGLKIIKNLNIKININNFAKIKTKCLKDYI